MNRLFQTLLIAVVALMAFVVVGVLAARFIGFRYEVLTYVAWIIPVGVGFFATKDNPVYLGMVAGAVIEFVRMTLGWAFASSVEVGPSIGEPTVGALIRTIVLLTLLGAAWGLFGGGIRWMISLLIKHRGSHA